MISFNERSFNSGNDLSILHTAVLDSVSRITFSFSVMANFMLTITSSPTWRVWSLFLDLRTETEDTGTYIRWEQICLGVDRDAFLGQIFIESYCWFRDATPNSSFLLSPIKESIVFGQFFSRSSIRWVYPFWGPMSPEKCFLAYGSFGCL